MSDIKELTKQNKAQNKDLVESNEEVAASVQASTMESRAQAQETMGVFTKMFGVLQKMFDFQVLARKEDKRNITGAKETVAEERKPIKIDTVEVDGFEGIFGAILGAVAAFVAGFVAEVTRVYKAIILSFQKIPALVKTLGKGVVNSVKAIYKSLEVGFRFVKGTVTAIFEDTKIAEAFVGLKNFLIGEGSFLAEFSKDIKNLGKAYRSAFTEVKTAFKAIGSEGTLLGDVIRLFAEEAKVVKQAFKGLLGFQEVGTGVYEISATTGKITEQTKEVNRIARGLQNAFSKIIAPFEKAFIAVSESLPRITRGGEAAAETTSALAKFTGRIAEVSKDFRVLFVNAFEGIRAITAGIGKAKGPLKLVFEAVEGFTAAFKTVFSAVKPLGELVGKLFVPIIVVYETIANFFKAFTQDGAEAKSFGEKLLEATIGTFKGIIEELVTVPLDLVKDIVSWIGGKLGFSAFEETLDSFSFTEFFGRIFDDFFEAMNDFGTFLGGAIFDLINDPVGMAKDIIVAITDGIASLLSGLGKLVKGAVVKVLNLIPGVNIETEEDPEEAMKRELKDRKKTAESSGLVNNPTIGYATADEEKLKDLSNEQLEEMRGDWADYKKVSSSIDAEMQRRLQEVQEPTSPPAPDTSFADSEFPTAKKPEKVNEATMAQAIRPEPVAPTPVVVETPTPEVSSPQVQGGSQDAKDLLDELTMREDQLAQTKAQGSGSGMGPIMNAPTSVTNNNSVVNKSFYQDQPSSRDDTDMLYIYRATGNSR